MNQFAIQVRRLIEFSDLAEGQRIVRKMLRQAGRRVIKTRMVKYNIWDFDHIFVEQFHRDSRDAVVARAVELDAQSQSASTTDELLVIFDEISANL